MDDNGILGLVGRRTASGNGFVNRVKTVFAVKSLGEARAATFAEGHIEHPHFLGTMVGVLRRVSLNDHGVSDLGVDDKNATAVVLSESEELSHSVIGWLCIGKIGYLLPTVKRIEILFSFIFVLDKGQMFCINIFAQRTI
jgi:hypothetical protein